MSNIFYTESSMLAFLVFVGVFAAYAEGGNPYHVFFTQKFGCGSEDIVINSEHKGGDGPCLSLPVWVMGFGGKSINAPQRDGHAVLQIFADENCRIQVGHVNLDDDRCTNMNPSASVAGTWYWSVANCQGRCWRPNALVTNTSLANQPPVGVNKVSCVAVGGGCVSDGDCCYNPCSSTSCFNGQCIGSWCRSVGATCEMDCQCCSHHCEVNRLNPGTCT